MANYNKDTTTKKKRVNNSINSERMFYLENTCLQVFWTLNRDETGWDLRKRRKLQRLAKKFLRKLRYLIPPHQTTLTVIKQRSGLRSNLDGESLGKFFRDEKRFFRSSYKSYISPSLGLKYGILETDCCDCPVVKCLNCKSVTPEAESCPRGAGARPADCYRYTKHHSHASEDGCWKSHCTEKSSDASNSVS